MISLLHTWFSLLIIKEMEAALHISGNQNSASFLKHSLVISHLVSEWPLKL